MTEIKISIIEGFHNVLETTTMYEIYSHIKGGRFKEVIEHVMQLYRSGRIDEADDVKKTLLAFTTSGVFSPTRKTENLSNYSQILMLDLDDLPIEKIDDIKARAISIPYTLLCFTSPSGLGIKIAVQVNSGKENHKEAYSQVVQYYSTTMGEVFDTKTNDIARLCFFSYDKEAYYNEYAKIFNVGLQKETTTDSKNDVNDSDFELKFNKVVNYTENKLQFEKGSRNNFIHLLGFNCNCFGLNIEKVIHVCIEIYGSQFNKSEINSAIKSAYKNNTRLFATKAAFLQNLPAEKNESKDKGNKTDFFSTTRTIPQFVVDNLTDFIKILATNRESERERDIIITAMLVLLSGSLHNVHGKYDDYLVYPSLFAFVVAPAGSGKGVMRIAREAFNELNKKIESNSKEELAKYYKALEKLKDGEDEPEKPPYYALFIPGNSSSAAIFDHLDNCEGRGVFCETEADAIGNILKNDWGDFSYILRAAFHHESVSINRKSGRIEIDLPKLAAILTGTPSQVPSIIKSIEDGLFSRFIYYCFDGNNKWRNVSPKKEKSEFTKTKNLVAHNIATMVTKLNEAELFVNLTEEQWMILNKHFESKLDILTTSISNDIDASVKRMGLITYRIAMTLTAVRKYEEELKQEEIHCSDLHFKMAIQLADIYLEHAVAMLESLPKKQSPNLNKTMQMFYSALPINIPFSRAEAIKIAKEVSLTVHEKTIDNYLDRLVKAKQLDKDGFSSYKKPLINKFG